MHPQVLARKSIVLVVVAVSTFQVCATEPPVAMPEHVCLPSVTQEDAAWSRYLSTLKALDHDVGMATRPAWDTYLAEIKEINRTVDERTDPLFERRRKLLSKSKRPCDERRRSPVLESACRELTENISTVDQAIREARDAREKALHKLDRARAPHNKHWNEAIADARASYVRAMLPACTIWQRITGQSIDRHSLRARQYCLTEEAIDPQSIARCEATAAKSQ